MKNGMSAPSAASAPLPAVRFATKPVMTVHIAERTARTMTIPMREFT
jgi:hypothetical protein